MKPSLSVTLDYELFLGVKSGTPENCLNTPTIHLLNLFRDYGVRATVFFDILYYWRVLNGVSSNPALRADLDIIKTNVASFLKNGHELELHLHPHWLDATYAEGEWTFPHYKHFRLHSLKTDNNPSDINTIRGCITMGKRLLEDLCSETTPHYKVNAFRAGGWSLEPMKQLAPYLKENGLTIDSSVAPGLVVQNAIHDVNFESCPDKDGWRFEDDARVPTANGSFKEIPISTFKNDLITKCRSFWEKYTVEPNVKKIYGDGTAIPFPRSRFFQKMAPSVKILTFENLTFFEMMRGFDSLVSRGHRRLVMAVHPKYVSPFAISETERFFSVLRSRGVRFTPLTEPASTL